MMVSCNETELKGVFIINNYCSKDSRGIFSKVLNSDFLNRYNLHVHYKECYYSISHENTIRGMHFQLPPFGLNKLVTVIQGSICDVVYDLRKDSPSYNKFLVLELSASDGKSVYIPQGCAHGFLSRDDNSIVLYNTSEVYHVDYDSGFRYDSFGFDWPLNENDVIISQRDQAFPPLNKFSNPF